VTPAASGSGKIYETSHFKHFLLQTEAPTKQYELMAAVDRIIMWYCSTEAARREGVSSEMCKKFFEVVQREAFENVDEVLGQLPSAAQRIWTSAKSILDPPCRLEFCSILNRALFSDSAEAAPHVAVVAQAINKLCIVRGIRDVSKLRFPKDGILWRGSSMTDEHKSFFRKGLKYRQPAFMSSTDTEEAAGRFLVLAYEAGQQCVMYTIKLDARGERDERYRCKHVNFVENSHIPNEKEFLFAPYSVFVVEEVAWQEDCNYLQPHLITLRASVDCRLEPPNLPLAPCK